MRARRSFILVAQLLHTEDGDDVLQLLRILLQRLLHAAGDAVVLLADDVRLKDTRGGGERIDRGVDALLGYLTAENGGSVKGGRRSSPGRVGGSSAGT